MTRAALAIRRARSRDGRRHHDDRFGERERTHDALRLRLSGHGPSQTFEARREGEAFVGTLHRDGGAERHVTLHRHLPGAEAPPPPLLVAGRPDDVPVNVTYDVRADGRSLDFVDWTVLPIPTGAWKGASIWGSGTGLVSVIWLPKGPNVSGQLKFTLTTWGLAHIGSLYINRWDVEDDKPVKIEPDSSVYWNDRWENVQKGTITMHRNPH
ncbi:MAG: hypothetical protein QOI11_2258 [Candidatus Eremiobacteraeota bacterium]|nr:hypothetical protein [Candidatus Eremiobacteraeota bacterium]